jgi:hypothetical protein
MQHFAVTIDNRDRQLCIEVSFIINGRECTVCRVQVNIVLFAGDAQKIVHSESFNFDGYFDAIYVGVCNTKGMAFLG